MASYKRHVDSDTISDLTVARLSVYLRCVDRLAEMGVETVSSQELARRFHLNSAQIRKDLAYFGEFGVRGVGYNVAELRQKGRVDSGVPLETASEVLRRGFENGFQILKER